MKRLLFFITIFLQERKWILNFYLVYPIRFKWIQTIQTFHSPFIVVPKFQANASTNWTSSN